MVGVSVTLVVHRNYVQENSVSLVWPDAGKRDSECWEHPPSGFGYDHLCTKVVELVPQFLGLQVALDIQQFLAVAINFVFLSRAAFPEAVPAIPGPDL